MGAGVAYSPHHPDWPGHAGLCGATGIRADRREQFDDVYIWSSAAEDPAQRFVQQGAQLTRKVHQSEGIL